MSFAAPEQRTGLLPCDFRPGVVQSSPVQSRESMDEQVLWLFQADLIVQHHAYIRDQAEVLHKRRRQAARRRYSKKRFWDTYFDGQYYLFATSPDATAHFLRMDGVIDWNKRFQFAGLPGCLKPAVHAVAAEKWARVEEVDYSLMYKANEAVVRQLSDIGKSPPPGFRMDCLTEAEGEMVAGYWSYCRPGTAGYIAELIKNNVSVCVREIYSGKAVGCVHLKCHSAPSERLTDDDVQLFSSVKLFGHSRTVSE